MNLLFILILFCTAMLSFVLLALLFRHRRKQRETGLKLLQALRMLVKHIQIHRGMTALQLSGELDIGDELLLVANSVTSDIDTISSIDPHFQDNDNWLGITEHWARLSSRNTSFNKIDYYDQHCRLVSACLALMKSVAFDYSVHRNTRPGEKLYWYELLTLGEGLGQLRALGTMHLNISKNSDTRQDRIKMISDCLKGIEALFFDLSLQERIGRFNCDEINNFLALVGHYIIENNAWITSERYFSRATETMEIIYTNFDEEMQTLLKQI